MMNVQYFIDRFEAIPEELWCTGNFKKGNKCCANGHLGVRILSFNPEPFGLSLNLTEESKALYHLFKNVELHNTWNNELQPGTHDGKYRPMEYSTLVGDINNGTIVEYQQSTPKQRILAALRDIQLKEQQDKAVEEAKIIASEAVKTCPDCGRPVTKCVCGESSDEQDEEIELEDKSLV